VGEHTFVNTNEKGNVAELAIAKEAAKLGLSVLKPLTEHERFDLVLGIGGRLYRVQCKWAKRIGEVVRINLTSSRRGPDGHIRSRYQSSEVDAIGAYCAELDRCFLIPSRLSPGRALFSSAFHRQEMDSARHYTSRRSTSSGL
jgi:hypothetical protein